MRLKIFLLSICFQLIIFSSCTKKEKSIDQDVIIENTHGTAIEDKNEDWEPKTEIEKLIYNHFNEYRLVNLTLPR